MKLEEVLNAINEPETADAVRPHWEESVASMGEDIPFFLQPDQVRVHRDWSGLAPELEPLLVETARRIAADPALRTLAWHAYRLLFHHEEYRDFTRWPSLEGVLGADAGIFFLLVSMGMVPRVREVHQQLGVPEEITRDTCREI
ncbi:MAG: acyltransferase domain-containing protein, partial [Armatimonadota bacterium]|nr:acyltransferase domain-containing protein [Armatimonadota bacterium]